MSKSTIREIFIDDSVKDFYVTPFKGKLTDLQRVTLLVGPNNSGKSRLLRSLYGPIHRGDVVESNSATEDLFRLRDELMKAAEGHPEQAKITNAVDEVPIPAAGGSKLAEAANRMRDHYGTQFSYTNEPVFSAALSYFYALFNYCSDAGNFANKNNRKVLYVPTTRGFRARQQDHFAVIAREDYWNNGPDAPEICAGDDMNETLRRLLLGSRADRDAVRNFEQFLGQYFFDRQSITLVPKEAKRRVEIKLGSEGDLGVEHLGDGIQHLILMLLRAFTLMEPVALLIEEPEVFLHPGLQTRLLDAFQSDEMAHVQVIATTHSNHLINLSVDRQRVAIMRLNKTVSVDDGNSEGVAKFGVTPLSIDDRSILSDLGVQKASVLLTNCVLFVEGPTDRRYYQRFLDIYTHQKKLPRFLPDLHYSFLEYGGSNISSYDFVNEDRSGINHSRLAGDRVLIITDKDDLQWKEDRRNLMKSFGKEVAVADAREVENLLPPEVVQSVLVRYERNRPDVSIPLFIFDEYQYKSLGTFIEEKIQSQRKSDSGHPYAAASGTLKDKSTFCTYAINNLLDDTLLPRPTMEIAEQIYDFIAASNRSVAL